MLQIVPKREGGDHGIRHHGIMSARVVDFRKGAREVRYDLG